MYEPDPDRFRYILSIDVGIHHLAMILIETTPDYTQKDVVWFELVNITQFVHLDTPSSKTCTIPHTRTVADWLSHLFYLNKELFDLCEKILIERQPPGGQIAIEQLLFFQYRSKAVLVHPRSVHAFFGWSDHDYNERKNRSIQVLEYALKHSKRDWLFKEYQAIERKHDILDAYTQAVCYLHREWEEKKKAQSKSSGELKQTDLLDIYRFQGSTSLIIE
jgi:hypothetical protein